MRKDQDSKRLCPENGQSPGLAAGAPPQHSCEQVSINANQF